MLEMEMPEGGREARETKEEVDRRTEEEGYAGGWSRGGGGHRGPGEVDS